MVSEEQSRKAKRPILVTVLGIVIEGREKQPEKVCSPIVVTPLGILIESVREEQ